MNNRIKIYAIVLAITYVCLIAFHLMRVIEPFMIGLEQGAAQLESRSTEGMESTFFVNVKPTSGLYSFPTHSSVGIQEGGALLEFDRVKVRQFLGEADMPSGYMVYMIIKTLIELVVVGYFLYVPFLFFGIVHAVTRGKMFDISVLRRLRKIGWIIISYYIAFVLIEVPNLYFNKQMIDIENYDIVFSMPSFMPLILGLVILFLAETLRIGLFMKEEQDLTI